MAKAQSAYNVNSFLLIGSFSVAILCLAIFVILAKRKTASRGTALLLLGPPDAGKTSILSTIVYSQTLPTHTSLQPNTSIVVLPESKKSIKVVDIPGHPRIRDQFSEHLSDSRAIVFVVDASTISRNGPAVAEHLHNILHALTSLPPSQTPPTLLILAHKADLLKTPASSLTAASVDFAINRVKTILERELEKRRLAQSGGVGVEGLGEEGERSDMGGLDCAGNGAFRFEEWEGGEITFLGSYVKPGKNSEDEEKSDNGLSSFQDWLVETL
ncbi:signal recognition particle receptor beta subunit-domain-containing protein [Infundibulicybe gibba]|nr:signal recognition particle receptor beta subunit-domain-containing protein [Infundibulicybe gibba]